MAQHFDHPSASAAVINASGDEKDESIAVNRYQRRLLYGGGIVLSIILAVLTGVLAYAAVRDEVARRYTDFAVRKLFVQLEFQAREFAVRTFATHEEAVWPIRPPAASALIDTFAAQHGQLVLRGDPHFDAVQALGKITPQQSAASFGRYLALADELSYRAGAYFKLQAKSQAMSGYLFSPDRHFIVLIPAPAKPLDASEADAQRLIQMIAPDSSDLSRWLALPASAGRPDMIWLPPAFDPIQRVPAFRLASMVSDDGKPFAIFISNLPTRSLLDRLPPREDNTASLILDDAGHVLLSTRLNPPSVDDFVARMLRTRPALRTDALSAHFREGMFVISQGIKGTDWTVAHAFSWRAVASALWPKLGAYAVAMLTVIGIIWGALIWLDRKVFVPAFLRTQRIMESEKLNRTMITTAPFGFALLSLRDRSILLQNDVMHAYDARMESREPLALQLLHLLNPSPTAPSWQNDLETTVAMNNGDTTDLLVNLVRTRYQGNDVVLCSFIDITARKNAERTLEEARAAADAANRAKSAFLATMSHEIRTPLHAILGNLELLDRSPLSSEQSERLHTVTTSSHALLDIISDILDFSKIESGQMTVEAIRFDLSDTIRQIGTMFAPITEAKGIRFECAIDDALAPNYVGDPTRIRQIVSNLISNAIKFTTHGTITLAVQAGNEASSASSVIIRVSDTGVGISATQQQQLFRPFTQADPSIARRFGGTGLGLALCRRLAELMDGTVSVQSELGIGSSFTVMLPLRAASVAHEPDEAKGDNHSIQQDRAAALRILIVEDHPANRVLFQAQLKTLGYHAELAKDGNDALEQIARAHYDLIMTDLNMPGMDGYALARQLRSQGASVPIIAITASASAEEHDRCRAAGIDLLLVKPLLLDAIDRIVRRFAGTVTSSTPTVSSTNLISGPLPPKVHALLEQSLQQSLTAIDTALDAGDWTVVRDHLHSLRGAFAMIQEMETSDMVKRLEERIAAKDIAALKAGMREFAEHAAMVLVRRAAVPYSAVAP